MNNFFITLFQFPKCTTGINQLNSLRNNPQLQNAYVTTYTYSPGRGLASETDARGISIYYEYDDFGRLLKIRDHENNIVEEYHYNYKNQ